MNLARAPRKRTSRQALSQAVAIAASQLGSPSLRPATRASPSAGKACEMPRRTRSTTAGSSVSKTQKVLFTP